MVGVFIREEEEFALDKKNTLYPFTLIFPGKERTFFLTTEGARDEWVSRIKEAVGYRNLFEQYSLKEAIGRGKFGTVRMAEHKKLHQNVAVKVLKKKEMTTADIELQKREIEILRVC